MVAAAPLSDFREEVVGFEIVSGVNVSLDKLEGTATVGLGFSLTGVGS